MTTPTTALQSIGACREAVDYVRTGKFRTLSAAWEVCPRGDWLLWYAGKMSGPPESEGRKKLVLAACECARLALPHAKSPAALACIEAAEKWARGEATIEQVQAARRAVSYADAAAAAAAADAAAAAAAAAAPTRKSCSASPAG